MISFHSFPPLESLGLCQVFFHSPVCIWLCRNCYYFPWCTGTWQTRTEATDTFSIGFNVVCIQPGSFGREIINCATFVPFVSYLCAKPAIARYLSILFLIMFVLCKCWHSIERSIDRLCRNLLNDWLIYRWSPNSLFEWLIDSWTPNPLMEWLIDRWPHNPLIEWLIDRWSWNSLIDWHWIS